MSTVFDFAPLWRMGIGFDRLFDLVDQAGKFEPADNYPPYNIEKTGDDAYRITLAVVGFAPDDLSITSQPNLLVVSGKKAGGSGGQYLYRGIADRVFERRFSLAEYIKVTAARLENGLLIIELVRELPEEMKPRRIAIVNGSEPAGDRGQASGLSRTAPFLNLNATAGP
jgi:molecular chaperone IbpA